MPNIDFYQVLIAFAILLLSLTIHEAAHAWSADRLGDGTARALGRVSLNPAVHVDPIGTILFPLLALMTGVPLIGWAKPVPVNVSRLRGNWRRKYMVVAAAGPASNLALAVIAALLFRMLASGLGDEAVPAGSMAIGAVGTALFSAIQLNVLLAIFNMIPIPPLDGGNVLAGVLRGPVAETFDRIRPYGFIILYGLMLSGVLWSFVAPIERTILSWLV